MGLIFSYPTLVYYFALLISVPLALRSPYRAFLFVVFGLSARHFAAAVQTRIIFGQYINLNDALILIGLLALFINVVVQRKPLRTPPPVLMLYVLLLISIVLGYFAVGDFDENVIRYSKYSLVFPTVFLLSVNFVTDSDRAKQFVWVLFAGALVGTVHHISLSVQAYRPGADLQTVRDIGFLLHPGYYFLVAAVHGRILVRKPRLILLLTLPLFAVSTLLDQTRSVWFGMVGAIVLMPLVLRMPVKRLARTGFVFLLVYLCVTFLVPYLLPGTSPFAAIENRLNLITHQYGETTSSRETGAREELNAWLSGNLLLGRGMGSQASFSDTPRGSDEVAYGHIGYVAYLTYTGMIGFIVYALYIPYCVIRSAKQILASADQDDFVQLIAVMGVVGVLMHIFIAAFTAGYISPSNAGLYYGATLGLLATTRQEELIGSVQHLNIYRQHRPNI